MARKHVTRKISVINETGMSSSAAGDYTTCEQLDSIRYEWIIANASSLNALLTFEVTDDLNGTWVTLDTDTYTLTANDVSDLYITQVIFKFIRPRIAFTAGSADIVVNVKAKTIAA